MPHTRLLLSLTLLIGLATFAGCRPEPTPPPEQQETTQHGHHHDHAHPDHGPRGGHIVELGDHQYHAEWLTDSQSGRVTVFIMDGQIEEDVAIDAETITIDVQLGDKNPSYQLAAVDAQSQDPPATARFEVVDRQLVEALNAVGHGVEATLHVEIEGQQYSGPFEDPHHHH